MKSSNQTVKDIPIGSYEFYQKEVVPKLKDELNQENCLAIPRIVKVVLNVGIGKTIENAKLKDMVINTLTRISGQKPVTTRAKKSISSFKIRQGMIIGTTVTLRGKRMNDFLVKLINVSLPRIRDFRGLDPKSVDEQGNLSIGIKEHTIFPEIKSDEIEMVHGLEVQIQTTAKTKKEGLSLLRAMGFPFKEGKE